MEDILKKEFDRLSSTHRCPACQEPRMFYTLDDSRPFDSVSIGPLVKWVCPTCFLVWNDTRTLVVGRTTKEAVSPDF
jgi:rubredoxin